MSFGTGAFSRTMKTTNLGKADGLSSLEVEPPAHRARRREHLVDLRNVEAHMCIRSRRVRAALNSRAGAAGLGIIEPMSPERAAVIAP